MKSANIGAEAILSVDKLPLQLNHRRLKKRKAGLIHQARLSYRLRWRLLRLLLDGKHRLQSNHHVHFPGEDRSGRC